MSKPAGAFVGYASITMNTFTTSTSLNKLPVSASFLTSLNNQADRNQRLRRPAGINFGKALLSVALFAAALSTPAQAGLFGISSGPKPVTHESQATEDGTPLKVKSQKLSQAVPKIYPSGLAGQSTEAARKVVIDIKAQRAYLFVDGKLAFETPVSTATKGRFTPRGTFSITEKIRTGKHSTLYKSAMPYWNRLGETAIGMHTGQLPGYPASHGCIRMPDESARLIFDNAPRGTTVQVVDALAATPVPVQPNQLVAAAR